MKRILVVLFIVVLIFACISELSAQENSANTDAKQKLKMLFGMLYSNDKVTIDSFAFVYDRVVSLEVDYILFKESRQGDWRYEEEKEKELSLESKKCESFVFSELRKCIMPLIGDIKLESIYSSIDSSDVQREGGLEELYIVNFTNGLSLFFYYDGVLFFRIWTPEGYAIDDFILKEYPLNYLKRPGMINDLDGYVNIRETESAHSLVVGKLMNDEVFYYTPNSHSNWWKVYRMGKYHSEGFIHKSRILEFKDFPEKYKEIVREERGGC